MKTYSFFLILLTITFLQTSSTFAQTTFTAMNIDGDTGFSQDVAIADLNGDTFPDIYVANNGAVNNLWINDGAANFTAMDIGAEGEMNSLGVAIADLNGDTFLDIYVANNGEQNNLWINDGAANFTAMDITGDTGGSFAVAIADLNGDTFPDIYVANSGQQNKLWINDGAANFTAMDITGDIGDSYGVAIADLNGDTFPDIYVANHGAFSGEQNKLWINDGAANFTAMDITGDTRFGYGVGIADLNGDTFPDIYVGNDNGEQNNLWINDGAANFTAMDIVGDNGQGDLAIADLDGDDYLDIYVTLRGQQNKLWINDGAANFTANNITGEGENLSYGTAIADLDGDDSLDIYVANGGGEQNDLFINNLVSEEPEPESNSSSSRSGGSRRVYTCKDSQAQNYNQFGTHQQSLCVYSSSTILGTQNNPVNTNLCLNPINQKMRRGDRDGVYSVYQGGVITQVHVLQDYIKVSSDGMFGPITRQGVVNFQLSHGLDADGIVGPMTLLKLQQN